MSSRFVSPVQRISRPNSIQKQFARNVQIALSKSKGAKAQLPYGISTFGGGNVRNFDSIALLPSKLAATAKQRKSTVKKPVVKKKKQKQESTAGGAPLFIAKRPKQAKLKAQKKLSKVNLGIKNPLI